LAGIGRLVVVVVSSGRFFFRFLKKAISLLGRGTLKQRGQRGQGDTQKGVGSFTKDYCAREGVAWLLLLRSNFALFQEHGVSFLPPIFAHGSLFGAFGIYKQTVGC